MKKLMVVGCSLFALIALAPKSADAANNITCTVTSVLWQKYATPAQGGTSAVPTDILLIGCSDGNGYATYIGSSSQVALVPPATNAGCYASADGVKAMESMAVAAKLAGKTLSIWWSSRSCPGNAGQRSIDSITL
jgi:hypothetical protein